MNSAQQKYLTGEQELLSIVDVKVSGELMSLFFLYLFLNLRAIAMNAIRLYNSRDNSVITYV